MKEIDPLDPPTAGARFVTTRWSVVLDAADHSSPASEAALAHLCGAYWYPLYAFARRRGHSPEEAQDLTQEFFARLIRTNFIASVSREKGRFRSFLLTVLKRFMINEWQRDRAQKRGGGAVVLSLDSEEAEARFRRESVADLPADLLYERRWALALLERVVESLREEFAAEGKGALFDGLKVFLYGEQGDRTQAEVGAQFGLSPSAVKAAVHRLRERYRRRLREEVADTVASPVEVDDELRHLLAVLSR